MPSLEALVYASSATRELAPGEIDALLLDARLFNASVEVTGVLFHGSGRFFQMIEGAPSAIEETFKRIQSAASHRDIRVLMRKPQAERHFSSWHMGFADAPATALQELSQAAWEDAMPLTRTTFETTESIALVLEHWNRWSAESANLVGRA